MRSSTDLRYVLRNMLNTEQKAQEADSAEYLESLEIVNGLFPTDRIVSVQTLQSQLKNRLHIQVVREETYEEEDSLPHRNQKGQFPIYRLFQSHPGRGKTVCAPVWTRFPMWVRKR